MESPNTKRSSVATDSEKQERNAEDKTKVLIVGGYPNMRQRLIPLINRESGLAVCAEAESACQALGMIRNQRIDFAIVDIYRDSTSSVRVVEEMKLHRPHLPVLILSMQSEALSAEWIANQQAGEKIIRAVRYVQSLLRSRIYGFSVLVKI